jgi:hypothetical protein
MATVELVPHERLPDFFYVAGGEFGVASEDDMFGVNLEWGVHQQAGLLPDALVRGVASRKPEFLHSGKDHDDGLSGSVLTSQLRLSETEQGSWELEVGVVVGEDLGGVREVQGVLKLLPCWFWFFGSWLACSVLENILNAP